MSGMEAGAESCELTSSAEAQNTEQIGSGARLRILKPAPGDTLPLARLDLQTIPWSLQTVPLTGNRVFKYLNLPWTFLNRDF